MSLAPGAYGTGEGFNAFERTLSEKRHSASQMILDWCVFDFQFGRGGTRRGGGGEGRQLGG